MAKLYDYSDCPGYLKEFLHYMHTIRGRSRRTVDAYYIDLRTFLRFVQAAKIESGDITDVEYFNSRNITKLPLDVLENLSLGDFYVFLSYTAEERENVEKTRARKVSSMRSFYHYLFTKAAYIHRNPVENLEVPANKKSVPRYLTLEECLELLTHMNPSSSSYARDYCMITFLLNCGMRLAELVGIDMQDIRKEDSSLRLLGKGNKERVIYLNSACMQALEAYELVRTQPKKEAHKNALFLSSHGSRISPRRVEQILEQHLKQAGLDGRGYSPHKLRHTAATLMYQHGGVDIRILQEILGHSNLGTTEIYTHLSNRQMEEAASKSPLSNVVPRKPTSVPKNINSDSDNSEAKEETNLSDSISQKKKEF